MLTDSLPPRRLAVLISKCVVSAVALLALSPLAETEAREAPREPEHRVRASQFLKDAGPGDGLVVLLPFGGDLAETAVAMGFEWKGLVHALVASPEEVEKARQTVASRKHYGRITVDLLQIDRLPYADDMVNLLIGSADLIGKEQILRVLRPGGIALLLHADGQQERLVKPWPEEIDEWTHWLHDADGNAVAEDTRVGPPRRVQWLADPRWQRHHELTPSVGAMVSSGGRVFALINEAPAGVDGGPDLWTLVARDGFNGTLLWKRPIREWGWKNWNDHSYGHGRWNHPTHIARRLVAVGEHVYMTIGFNAPLSQLDATTGQTLKTYAATEFADEVLYRDGTLVLVLNEAAQGPGKIKERAPVTKAVAAFDSESGRQLWRTGDLTGAASKADQIERITHLLAILGDDKVFVAEEDAIVALDLKTGKRLWSRPRGERPRPVTYGSYYFTNLMSMVCCDDVLLAMEPDPTVKHQAWNAPAKSTLLGISAETGETLWSRATGMWGHYNPGDIFVIDGLAWVHAGDDFSMIAVDPKTGETRQTLSTKEALDQGHHHRCYRNKATLRFFVTGRRGTEFIDHISGENTRHHWVRGTCRYGVMPCNGLLYAPPHPCVCYITSKLNGFWALAPAGEKEPPRAGKPSPALVRGAAYADGLKLAAEEIEGAQSDWPTYRADPQRSGAATSDLLGEPAVAWKTPLDGRPTAPTVAGGRLFVAVADAHTVHALDANDGKPLWQFIAGGRVDTPPTIHGGLAIFGSADGWVYCLRAADGALVWRRRAAPRERRIVCRERLESPWPVHGAVLVQDDVIYYTAGRSSFLDGGMIVQAVEPGTGRLIAQRRIDSLLPDTNDMVEAPLPYDMPEDAPGALPDVLVGGGDGKFFMRHLEFDASTLESRPARRVATKKGRRGHAAVGGHLMSVAGLLDDSWFNQTYWTLDGQSDCKLLVHDDENAYGIKPFAATARHSRSIFRLGSEDYTIFAASRPNHARRWQQKLPLRVIAMALADQRLFTAGTPDEISGDDPWAALEGRRGGVLRVVSTENGETLQKITLDAAPVYDGLAAARGRVYLSSREGVVCFDAR